jgi:ATP-binding cassette subfamily E protein 1
LRRVTGKLKPNLGRHDSQPEWGEILKHYRGSELQNYFTMVLEERLHAVMKPQYVDHIPRTAKGSVGTYMDNKGKGHGERAAELMTTLQLDHVRDRDVRR